MCKITYLFPFFQHVPFFFRMSDRDYSVDSDIKTPLCAEFADISGRHKGEEAIKLKK